MLTLDLALRFGDYYVESVSTSEVVLKSSTDGGGGNYSGQIGYQIIEFY